MKNRADLFFKGAQFWNMIENYRDKKNSYESFRERNVEEVMNNNDIKDMLDIIRDSINVTFEESINEWLEEREAGLIDMLDQLNYDVINNDGKLKPVFRKKEDDQSWFNRMVEDYNEKKSLIPENKAYYLDYSGNVPRVVECSAEYSSNIPHNIGYCE